MYDSTTTVAVGLDVHARSIRLAAVGADELLEERTLSLLDAVSAACRQGPDQQLGELSAERLLEAQERGRARIARRGQGVAVLEKKLVPSLALRKRGVVHDSRSIDAPGGLSDPWCWGKAAHRYCRGRTTRQALGEPPGSPKTPSTGPLRGRTLPVWGNLPVPPAVRP